MSATGTPAIPVSLDIAGEGRSVDRLTASPLPRSG